MFEQRLSDCQITAEDMFSYLTFSARPADEFLPHGTAATAPTPRAAYEKMCYLYHMPVIEDAEHRALSS